MMEVLSYIYYFVYNGIAGMEKSSEHDIYVKDRTNWLRRTVKEYHAWLWRGIS